jgi:hypothetical protein
MGEMMKEKPAEVKEETGLARARGEDFVEEFECAS